MIIKADKYNCKEILSYIGNEYYKCIYLYLDICKYGFEDANVTCWIMKENNEIKAVILKYYTGMHIYSKKRDFDKEELENLIIIEQPTIICAEKEIIEKLQGIIENGFEVEYGWVRELKKLTSIIDDGVKKAAIDDFKEIAKLLFEDEDIGSSYELDVLEKQMIERNQQKFVRNYVIKNENGNVISHAGTGAEDEKLAMLSYVITHPQYRGRGLAKRVCKAVCSDLIDEGKNVYLINYSNESTALYDKIGFKICCEWGKLYKNLKK